MKILKKCVLGSIAIGLSLSLVACNNGGSDNNNENTVSLSNVLNSKKMLPIVVTHDKQVSWAGYIGKGKIKAMYLDGTVYDYGYNDLKKLNNKKFNESIVYMGKDYKPKPRKYQSSKANINITTDTDTETKVSEISFDYLDDSKKLDVSSVKDIVSEPRFNEVLPKDKDEEWASMKYVEEEEDDPEGTGYVMHVKVGKQVNLKLDDVEKSEKQYDNVEVNPIEE
ncbi:TPA: hypothetical protein PC496_000781 [Clostridioides difficile]|nr:hypothetical protein [Clostridioides difficile]